MPTATLDALLDRIDGIADVVRDGAAESERLGHLTPAVLDALLGTGAFGMLVPADLGGLELTLAESTAVFERVASFDASTAWVLAILSDGPLFARFSSTEALTAICEGGTGLLSGSLNPTGRAERCDDGFRFTGTATYLSGSTHARWAMATALVTEGGQLVIDDGMPEIRAGIFPIDQARSLDSWNVTGMRATGSSDYAFEDVHIDVDWTFEPFRPNPAIDDVFAAIPLWAQLGSSLAACAVGTARNMIDRFVELAATKVPVGGNMSRLAERAPAQIAVGEAEGLQQAARAVLFDTISQVWDRGVAREPFDDPALARQRLGAVTAMRLSAQAVDLLHDVGGMSAVSRDSVLERCWRDIHTMSQHVMLANARFEVCGRVLLGLDPGSPVI